MKEGSVASSRWENKVPLDPILQNGNWKGEKKFFKFYFKEVKKDNLHDTCDKNSGTEQKLCTPYDLLQYAIGKQELLERWQILSLSLLRVLFYLKRIYYCVSYA